MKDHLDYITEVNNIILYRPEEHNKIYEYTNFSFKHLSGLNDIKNNEIIKYVIDNTIDLNEITNDNLWRPIHKFCNYYSPEIIKYATSKNIDLNCYTNRAIKPIDLICRFHDNETIKWALQSNKFELNLNNSPNDFNYIDLIGENSKINKEDNAIQKLLSEGVIKLRECGYALKYLKEQTIEQCQDAIDHDPSNIRFVKPELLRYFK